MGVVIFLPMPLGHVLPSLGLVLLNLDWMLQDGVALPPSAVMGLASIAYAVMFWLWVGQAVIQGLGLSPAPGWRTDRANQPFDRPLAQLGACR